MHGGQFRLLLRHKHNEPYNIYKEPMPRVNVIHYFCMPHHISSLLLAPQQVFANFFGVFDAAKTTIFDVRPPISVISLRACFALAKT